MTFLTSIFLAATLAQGPAQQPQTPQPAQQPAITMDDVRRYEDVLKTQVEGGENWTESKGKYVDLHFVKRAEIDQAMGDRFAQVLDVAVVLDCQALALDSPTVPVPVYLYPDSASLSIATGNNEPLVDGMSFGNWAALVYPKDGSLSELLATGVHVIGKAVVHSEIGLYNCPLLGEGTAFYLQGQYRSSAWIAKPVPIEKKSIMSLIAGPVQSTDDYLQGARFISYLISMDKGKPDRFKQVLEGINKEILNMIRQLGTGSIGERVNRTFVKVYGKPIDELDKSWQATAKTL